MVQQPKDVHSKAKQRARLALTDPSIKLTTLERSFYNVFKEQQQTWTPEFKKLNVSRTRLIKLGEWVESHKVFRLAVNSLWMTLISTWTMMMHTEKNICQANGLTLLIRLMIELFSNNVVSDECLILMSLTVSCLDTHACAQIIARCNFLPALTRQR